MQRYFINNKQLINDQVTIQGDDVHHITNVMRGSVGERLMVCCEKKSYLAEITLLSKTEVRLRVVEEKEENVELPVFVTIAQGIVKGDKFDLVIQKGAECGASGFVPVVMKRSVARIDGAKADKKVARWQKIALEAARQSHRQVVPVVKMPVDMRGFLELAANYDVCLFAYEAFDDEARYKLADVIGYLESGMRVLVLIGPEGGIDEDEVVLLTEAGFKAIGLGPRILRTETAPIYVLSALSYGLEIER